jgi:ADP-ribosylglycohydrolase
MEILLPSFAFVHPDAVKGFGSSCAMPGAFTSALLAALSASSYEEGIRINIMAGGDNCSRGIYLGALLGAAYGAAGVPASWQAKVTGMSGISKAAEGLFSS